MVPLAGPCLVSGLVGSLGSCQPLLMSTIKLAPILTQPTSPGGFENKIGEEGNNVDHLKFLGEELGCKYEKYGALLKEFWFSVDPSGWWLWHH